jgi:hypothetical protein
MPILITWPARQSFRLHQKNWSVALAEGGTGVAFDGRDTASATRSAISPTIRIYSGILA